MKDIINHTRTTFKCLLGGFIVYFFTSCPGAFSKSGYEAWLSYGLIEDHSLLHEYEAFTGRILLIFNTPK